MFQRVKHGIFLTVFMGLVAGCTTMGSGSAATRGFMFGKQDGSSQARDLVPGDGVEVSVEVDGRMEVSLHRAELNHQGIVTLPLVGDVKIGGMKLAAARDVIAKTYGAYYVNPPVVMLALMDGDVVGEWGFVTVLGRVNKPGRVPLQKTSDIRISRTDEMGMKTRVSVDFKQIGQAGNADADIMLIDGDIIYVPERIF